ncbi:MAG: hypothetical protein LBE36_13585 [Flavobacteriaceae bacterium]|nr:hypothetical protein [Flavobacteriaceae bacterium]
MSQQQINILYESIQTVLNKNNMGKVDNARFNSVLQEAMFNIQENLFSDFRKLAYRKMKFQDTPNYGSEALYRKQAIEYYIAEKNVAVADGKVNLYENIDDIFLLNEVFSDKALIEKTDANIFNRLGKIKGFSPTNCSPVFTYNNGLLKISPKTINEIDVVYFREIKPPKRTIKIIDETEVFNPDDEDFQDIDMHPIMLHAIFIEVLGYFGLNLKEEYAIQYANALKQEAQIDKQ